MMSIRCKMIRMWLIKDSVQNTADYKKLSGGRYWSLQWKNMMILYSIRGGIHYCIYIYYYFLLIDLLCIYIIIFICIFYHEFNLYFLQPTCIGDVKSEFMSLIYATYFVSPPKIIMSQVAMWSISMKGNTTFCGEVKILLCHYCLIMRPHYKTVPCNEGNVHKIDMH